MATKKKLLQAAAGQAGGAGLNVEEVFSTYLYTGNSSTQTITNGIDLSGEGGLVWIKRRDAVTNHFLFDTERGATNYVLSNSNIAQSTNSTTLTSFGSDSFSLAASSFVNSSGQNFASWTFRKAPKFFDVVTYTGNSTAGRTVSHNLGSVPGMIIIKNLDVAVPWAVYHRSMGDGVGGGADENFYMNLNENFARAASSSYWNNTAPTSTTFTLGTANRVNATGSTYVAYLFAHNNGDGDFGPDGDQDIIKCGSYTGNGGALDLDLGFEPQWFLSKVTSTTGNWNITDSMRGFAPPAQSSQANLILQANTSSAEQADGLINPTATGLQTTYGNTFNESGKSYIYIAIRRGPMAVPDSATDVFAVTTQTGTVLPAHDTGFVTDFSLRRENALNSISIIHAVDRLRGTKYLTTEGTNAEISDSDNTWDFMDGWYGATSNDSNKYAWSWRRAPSFFDAVAYSGNSTAGRTVSHNLGVAPEMMWVKARSEAQGWAVYHSALGATKGINLNLSNAAGTTSIYWNDTEPTASNFTLNTTWNASSQNYIAYLFASLDGVSKVGSYTGNGTSQTINCGFSAGARFILIKRTDSTGDWYVWDTERGIVAGNDPHFSLNSTAAQVTTDDSIDPDNSGFIVNQVSATNINVSSATYIFYAIA